MPYLTPDEVPEGTACRPLYIPDDTAWLALVSGMLTSGTLPWNWEKFGTLTVDECVAVMQGIVDSYYADACGECLQPEGEPVLRVNTLGNVQQLTDGMWTEPTGDYAIPPIPARTEPTAYERRCLASANCANVLQLCYEEALDDFTGGAAEAEVFITFALKLGALVIAPFGLIAIGLYGMFAFGWHLVFELFAELTADYWDSEFTDALTCILLDNSTDTDGVVTFDFPQVCTDITDSLVYKPDFTLGQQKLALQLGYMLQYIGAQGLDTAGTTTDIEEYDCDACNAEWCFWFDYTVSEGDFSVGDGSITWESGNGFKGANFGSNSCRDVFGSLTLPFDVSVTRAIAIFGRSSDIGGGNVFLRFQTKLDGTQVDVYNAVPGASGTPLCIELDTPQTIDYLYIDSNSGVGCGDQYFRGFVLYGTGENPFGDDNCEGFTCS